MTDALPFLRLVPWAAGRLLRASSAFQAADQDDLGQELVVQLLLAARRYDPARGVAKFASYAAKCLLLAGRQFLGAARARVRRGKNTHGAWVWMFSEFDSRLSRGDHEALAIGHPGFVAVDEADDHAARMAPVADAMRFLSVSQATVIRLRFGLGGDRAMTLDEVGRLIGRTRERVRQIEARALDRLRAHTA